MTFRCAKLGVLVRVSVLATSALCGEAPDPSEIDRLPPRTEFVLEIDGHPIAIGLGESVEVEIGGKKTLLKLGAKPHREFNKFGIRFKFPASFVYSADTEDRLITTWTLEGSDAKILIFRLAPGLDHAVVRKNIISELKVKFGKETTESKVSIVLGGKTHNGERIAATLAGENIIQEYYSLSIGAIPMILSFQDSPKEGHPRSKEGESVRKLLEETFTVLEKAIPDK